MVTRVGRGRQRVYGTVSEIAAAGRRTASERSGDDGQRVGIDAEVRHIVAGSRSGERVGRVSGNHIAVLRPVRERVACVGRGGQRDGLSVRVGACTAHYTANNRIGRGIDFIGVDFEESDKGVVAGHLYMTRVDDIAVVPVCEVVALVGRSRQRGFLTVGVCTAASHSTACYRIGSDGQRVGVDLEVCHEISGSRYGERVGGIGGNFRTAHRPVHEVVARIGSGNQRGGRIVVIVACASHITACSRIGCGVDGVAVGQEGGRYRHIGGGHDKGIARHFNRSQFRSYIP